MTTNYKNRMVWFSLSVFILSLVVIFDVEAASSKPSLKGKLCWKLEAEGGTGNITVVVTKVASNVYTLNGISTNDSSSAIAGATNGNAVIKGNKVFITLNESHIDEYATSISTYSLILNKSTLNGIGKVIGLDYNYSHSDFEPMVHTDLTVSLINCSK